MEDFDGKTILFFKGKNYIKTINYDKILQKHSMITKWLVTPESLKRSIPLATTTGGQAYKPSLKFTRKDSEPVTNLKLTDNHPNHHFNPQKVQNLPDPLATA